MNFLISFYDKKEIADSPPFFELFIIAKNKADAIKTAEAVRQFMRNSKDIYCEVIQ